MEIFGDLKNITTSGIPEINNLQVFVDECKPGFKDKSIELTAGMDELGRVFILDIKELS